MISHIVNREPLFDKGDAVYDAKRVGYDLISGTGEAILDGDLAYQIDMHDGLG